MSAPNYVERSTETYIKTHCESRFVDAEGKEEIIGWKKVQMPQSLKSTYEKHFDAVEPIYKKGITKRPNAMAYHTRFKELYEHYLKWCAKNKRFYKIEDDFRKILYASFPGLTGRIDTVEVEFEVKDKDGKHEIDPKTGHPKRQKSKIRVEVIEGIKFCPEGVKSVPQA